MHDSTHSMFAPKYSQAYVGKIPKMIRRKTEPWKARTDGEATVSFFAILLFSFFLIFASFFCESVSVVHK